MYMYMFFLKLKLHFAIGLELHLLALFVDSLFNTKYSLFQVLGSFCGISSKISNSTFFIFLKHSI